MKILKFLILFSIYFCSYDYWIIHLNIKHCNLSCLISIKNLSKIIYYTFECLLTSTSLKVFISSIKFGNSFFSNKYTNILLNFASKYRVYLLCSKESSHPIVYNSLLFINQVLPKREFIDIFVNFKTMYENFT